MDLRLACAALALTLLAGPAAAQLALDPISPAEGTFGSVITITGTGDFGKGKPKVTLEAEGQKPVKLKVLTIDTDPDATTLTAELKTAKAPGAYSLNVQAKGKDGAAGTAPNTFEVQPPVLIDTPTTGDVNSVLQVLTQWTGEKKVKFTIGGKKAKAKLAELITDGAPGLLTWDVTVPKSLPNGLAQIGVSNKLGKDSTEGLDGIQVTGSTKKLGKDSITATVDGKALKMSGKLVAGLIQTVPFGRLFITGNKTGKPQKTITLGVPFNVDTDLPPQVYDVGDIGFGAQLLYTETTFNGLGSLPTILNWAGTGAGWSITVTAASAGQVAGTFSGPLASQDGGADVQIDGSFIITPE